MRESREVPSLVRDDDALRKLGRETVVDLLALEPREHPIGRRRRDQLTLREQGEERTQGVRGRPVVLAVVERDVEVGHTQLRERRVDVRSSKDVPEGEGGPVV